jgi:hypothetical protein
MFARLKIETKVTLTPVTVKSLINESITEMFGSMGTTQWPVDVLDVQSPHVIIAFPEE